jgi:hypothetical protein
LFEENVQWICQLHARLLRWFWGGVLAREKFRGEVASR